MPAPITVRIELQPADIQAAGQKIARELQDSLNGGLANLRETGKRMGEAVNSGAKEALAKATQLREQLESVLSPDKRIANAQVKEIAHQQRLRQIHEQGAAQLAAVEQKKQAQIAAIQERALQQELARQRRLEQQASQGGGFQAFLRRYASTIRESGESLQQFGFALLGASAGIIGLGRAALQSAVNIDAQINVLRSLTGSAAAAEARFAALVKLAQQTPGLTTGIASALDAQLRIAGVSEQVIDRFVSAIGRLNAVQSIGDPTEFANNLRQLVDQGFERADLKQVVNRNPIAGELIRQIFGVDNPTNGEAIRKAAQKLGIDSAEEFFAAFAEAAKGNQKLANVNESLATQFEKLKDRVLVALRPLGLAIVEAFTPIVERAVPIIEQLGSAFKSLPDSAQQAIIVFGLLAAAIGPLVIAVGGFIQAFGAIGNIVTVIGALGAGSAAAATGVGALGAATTATAAGVTVLGVSFPPLLVALAAVAGAVGLAVGAYKLYEAATAQSASAIRDHISASQQQIQNGQKEVDNLRNLAEASTVTSQQQQRLQEIYNALTPVQRERVNLYAAEAGGAETLSGKLTGLIQLFDSENAARREKLRIEAQSAGPELIRQAEALTRTLADQNQIIERTSGQIDKYTKAQAAAENATEGVRFGIFGVVTDATNYQQRLRELQPQLDNTRAASERSTRQLQEIAVALAAAAKASGVTTSEFIKQALATAGLNGQLGNLHLRLLQLASPTPSAGAPSRAGLLAQGVGIAVTPPRVPVPAGLGGSGGGKSDAQRAAEELMRAREDAVKSGLENIAKLERQAAQDQLEILRSQHEAGKLSTREYYTERFRLTEAGIQAEITSLAGQRAELEKQLAATKIGSAERVKLETKIGDLLTEQLLKVRALTLAATQGAAEFKKALGSLPTDLTKQLEQQAQVTLPDIVPPVLQRAREQLQNLRERSLDFQQQEADLRVDELRIQNLLHIGAVNEAQAKQLTLAAQRQHRDAMIASLEASKQLASSDPLKVAQIQAQIENLRTLGLELTPLQGFFKGLRSESETLAEQFERVGQRLKDSIFNQVERGIDAMTRKLGFLRDIVGDILKTLLRNVVGGILGRLGGGGGQQAGAQSLGGFFANLLGGGQGGGGGLFTGGFAGGSGAGSIVGGGSSGGIVGLIQQIAGGGGISAGPSISGGLVPLINGIPAGIPTTLSTETTLARAAGARGPGLLSALFGSGGLFQGIGFGRAPGTGGALAGALPLLGLSLGSSLGGQSTIGRLLGSAGGLLAGVGAVAAPSIFAAGGALASPLIAGLFSNPFTIAAGAALLIGSFFFGRARQRRSDEEASGQYLADAVANIHRMRDAAKAGQITSVEEARGIFESNIIAQFVSLINTLQTRSVRESRLTNQVRDLRALFEKEVIPEIKAAVTRTANRVDLIPEFHSGGFNVRERVAVILDNETILTAKQTRDVMALSGYNIFERVGVPNAGQMRTDGLMQYHSGAQSVGAPYVSLGAPASTSNAPILIQIDSFALGITDSDTRQIFIRGARSSDGRRVIISTAQQAQQRREL